jgi:hypothetical protein
LRAASAEIASRVPPVSLETFAKRLAAPLRAIGA